MKAKFCVKKKNLLLIAGIVWMTAGFNVARLGVLSYMNIERKWYLYVLSVFVFQYENLPQFYSSCLFSCCNTVFSPVGFITKRSAFISMPFLFFTILTSFSIICTPFSCKHKINFSN